MLFGNENKKTQKKILFNQIGMKDGDCWVLVVSSIVVFMFVFVLLFQYLIGYVVQSSHSTAFGKRNKKYCQSSG